MVQNNTARAYRRQDVEEFDRRIRRFHESLAHKERRILRQLIVDALSEADMDVSGYLQADDEAIFDAMTAYLMGLTT